MFTRKFGENLRRLDVGCVQRARWLGAWKPERSDLAAAEDKRQQMKTAFLRMDDFNRR